MVAADQLRHGNPVMALATRWLEHHRKMDPSQWLAILEGNRRLTLRTVKAFSEQDLFHGTGVAGGLRIGPAPDARVMAAAHR